MKHTLFSCAKYKRLRSRLPGHPECAIVGALEMLFQFGNANGDVLNVGDVEAVCGWIWPFGEPGDLLNALTDTGGGMYSNFLDLLPDGKHVQIHDFYEHAPDSVRNRKRQQEHRESVKRNMMSQCVCDSHTQSHTVCDNNDKRNETKRIIDSYESTAEPVTEPDEGVPQQGKLKGTGKQDWKAKASETHLFTAFNLYPSVEWRGNPKDCQEAWDAAAKEVGGYDVLLVKVQKHLEWWDRSKVPRFVKYLEEGWYNAVKDASKGSSKAISKQSTQRVEGNVL